MSRLPRDINILGIQDTLSSASRAARAKVSCIQKYSLLLVT